MKGNKLHVPNWILGGKIIISSESGIKRACSKYVKEGAEKFMEEAGLRGFNTEDIGLDERIGSLVEKSVRKEGSECFIDFQKLEKNFLSLKRSNILDSSNAYVILSKKREHMYIDCKWGIGDYNSGLALIKLSGSRQDDLNHIQKVSEHVVLHLLGYKESKDIPSSRAESENCLAYKPGEDLCEACAYKIRTLWKRIGDITGKEFLREDVLKAIQYSDQV